MDSIWSQGLKAPHFEPLEGNKQTEVLIIGGGLAGVLCAYHLERAGVDCILCEKDTICSGVTQNTTAKITAQHGLIYQKLIKSIGQKNAALYLEANLKAVEKYRELCQSIDCDFENTRSVVYSLSDKSKLDAEIQALSQIGFRAKYQKELSLPIKTAGGVVFEDSAQFNPLKFVYGIVPSLKIYEHTKVLELAPNTAICENGKIRAKKIIICTHFPILNKHGAYFVKMYQHRSYVLALKGADRVGGMYVDERDTGLSFRNYGDLLLLGGGSHRTGKNGGNYKELEEFVASHYKNAKIVYRYATQDCMTLERVPYIGRYSKNSEDLFVATGFNKWGMTSSMVASEILRDQILGAKNKYSDVFSPSRSILHPQLAVNAFETVVNFASPTTKRCPHLGCALKWNADEHSWDCPCHGSRFDKDGELLNGPATDGLKNK